MEFPQYTLKPNPTRMLFPQFIKMFLLSLAFYAGLKVNFIILEIGVGAYVDVLVILGLLVLSVMQVILTKKHQTKIVYNFYANRIDKLGFKPASILFADVKNISLKRSIFDKIFKTGEVFIEPEFKIESVSNSNQIYAYVQKLVQNFRYQAYSQYYQQPNVASATAENPATATVGNAASAKAGSQQQQTQQQQLQQ